GAWPALWQVNPKDKNNNVIYGDVITHDTTDSYIYSQSRVVTTVGLKDIIVVETKDAVLVTNKENAQGVKEIVEELKRQNRTSCID
ncbi:MAG: mannose-1-phosphate guanylyltransferase/mannose-6-phosphate isomerase, partial [Spirochaetaceae bacterium]|nr:mannose-1-phosphate guanylyltransferase/mannose-6-phosphate isomerase [Spirochaetaceae bacterium]